MSGATTPDIGLDDVRILANLFWCALGDYGAPVHDDDPFGQTAYEFQVVVDQQNADPAGLSDFDQAIGKVVCFGRIHACGRFVEKQHRWILRQCPRGLQTLARAIGQIVGAERRHVRKVKGLQLANGDRGRGATVVSDRKRGDEHVLEGGQPPEQPQVLKAARNPVFRHLMVRHAGQIDLAHARSTCISLIGAGQKVNERRFTRTIRSDKPGDATCGCFKTDVGDCFDPGKALRQALGHQPRVLHANRRGRGSGLRRYPLQWARICAGAQLKAADKALRARPNHQKNGETKDDGRQAEDFRQGDAKNHCAAFELTYAVLQKGHGDRTRHRPADRGHAADDHHHHLRKDEPKIE